MSRFSDVPVLSCAGVGPAALVVLTAVDIPGIFAVARISTLAAITTAVDVLSAVSVSNIFCVHAVASVPVLGLHAVACVPTAVNIQFPLVLATLLLLASPDVVGVP